MMEVPGNIGVPSGWVVQTDQDQNLVFKSPLGTTFPSRRQGLKHMIDNGDTKERIAEMRMYLEDEGWSSIPEMPPNWLVKTEIDSRGWKVRKFLSDKGRMFSKVTELITAI